MTAALEPTTRMAVRAAVVAVAALLVGYLLNLERAYGAILTGVVLINETWGDSVRRTVHRLATGAGTAAPAHEGARSGAQPALESRSELLAFGPVEYYLGRILAVLEELAV
jgi:hypothetical protein